MPISGLAITLKENAAKHDVLRELSEHAQVTIGETHDRKIAVVVETSSQEEDQDVQQRIREISGISHVDIVFIGFDDDADVEQL